jgi:hypothetical protein
LKGEALAPMDVLIPLMVCAVITLLCLAFIARQLRAAALR